VGNHRISTEQLGCRARYRDSLDHVAAPLFAQDRVFFGDSTNQNTSSPGGTVTTTIYRHDTFVGTDSTRSGDPVSLTTAGGELLLASLTLNAAITNVGDSYTISLVPSTGDGSMNSSLSTFFDVFNFQPGWRPRPYPSPARPGS
jgi:hypothetical protein